MKWELITDSTLRTYHPRGTAAFIWGPGDERPLMMAFSELPDLELYTHICVVEPPELPQSLTNNPASQS